MTPDNVQGPVGRSAVSNDVLDGEALLMDNRANGPVDELAAIQTGRNDRNYHRIGRSPGTGVSLCGGARNRQPRLTASPASVGVSARSSHKRAGV